MKSFFLCALLIFSVTAKASSNCAELYAQASAEEITKQNKLRERGATVYGLSLAALFTGNIFIVSGFLLGGSGMVLTANLYDAPEIRANDLKIEGSKRLVKFTKKMQKRFGNAVTEMEVLSIVNEGMDNGLFCSNAPALATPKEIRSYVEGVLEARYQTEG